MNMSYKHKAEKQTLNNTSNNLGFNNLGEIDQGGINLMQEVG